MYTPTALTQASELSAPGRRGQATAIVLSGATAAAVAGVPAGLFPAAAVGWRPAFAVIAGGSACAGCALALLTPAGPARHGAASRLRRVLADRQTQRIACVTLLAYLGEFTLYSYLALALTSLAHVGTHQLPVYYLLFGAAGVAGNIAGGSGSDRWAIHRLASSALVLLASSLAAVPPLLFSAGVVAVPHGLLRLRRLDAQRPAATPAAGRGRRSARAQPVCPYVGLTLSGITGALLLRIISIGDLGYAAGCVVLIALAVSLISQPGGNQHLKPGGGKPQTHERYPPCIP